MESYSTLCWCLFFQYLSFGSTLGNLIENAIGASAPLGHIIVGCTTTSDQKYIYVWDEGCGISPDNLDKITEPFYRVDKSRSRIEGGLGLGLNICRNIVEKHGARLHISSKVNKGTEVRIVWPVNETYTYQI